MTVERVVVVGGAIAGLATALALEGVAREVVIVERDPEPPAIDPSQAFEQWTRPGVPQFRHAHILLARLQTQLRDDFPDLHAQLLAAGIELSELREMLPEGQLASYQEQPGDRDLIHLWGRRPTFEYVARRHVEQRPHVRFLCSAKVERLIAHVDGNDVQVRGVEIVREGRHEQLIGDVVVDASGKRTGLPAQLEALGVKHDAVLHPTNRIYVCRHYQLVDASKAPRRIGGGADHDYFGYATFFAEHGHYALSLSCPTQEHEVASSMKRPEGFEAICAELPVIADWLRCSKPTSKVLGAGNFMNRWTRFGVPGGRALRGYLAVGDAHIETNPMYGRGCALAFAQAKELAAAMREAKDPVELAQRYYSRVRRVMQPHFDFCIGADRMMHARGKLTRGESITFVDRAIKYAYETAFVPAMHQSPLVAREMVKAMEMRDLSNLGTRFAVLGQLLRSWLRGLVRRSSRPRLPEGPEREALLASLPALTASESPADAQAAAAAAQDGSRASQSG